MKRKLAFIIAFLTLLFVGNSMASAQESDAVLELRPSVTSAVQGDEIEVDVVLKNPGHQSVISVRAWLDYNPNALEGLNIVTQDSPFTLAAPGEDKFNAAEGHAEIGRSNISGGVTDSEVVVATVRFRVKTASPLTTSISPYDYQVTELGHTSVNIIDQGFPVNILSEEPDAIQIKLNNGSSIGGEGEGEGGGEGEGETENSDDVVDIGGSGFADLLRPQNLKAHTGDGYVDLKWDMGTESTLSGYNIYYGKTSGHYTRRRTVSKTDHYRIDGLYNNEVYYFAITAYDGLDRESDYSDEVGIIVNQPLSSTSPFDDFLNQLLAKLPTQPQNGPLMGWLIFSAIGLAGAILFRKQNTKI